MLKIPQNVFHEVGRFFEVQIPAGVFDHSSDYGPQVLQWTTFHTQLHGTKYSFVMRN
jgi:hypothetical protein